ncbi:MAG: CinA family protein [Clostridiales bacterium]|nr:CinA family protein [Clostridiales bacterium]
MADRSVILNEKALVLVEAFKKAGLTVGFAESLTGGLISASVVNIPGASAVLKGSVVSYTNEIKENVLGVPSQIIDEHTEVSEECAKAMAEGAKRLLNCDVAVSVTGIAGPTGDLPGKPVGTVYMGYCYSNEHISGAIRLNFNGDRDTIRSETVLAALECAVHLIERQGLSG